MSMTRKEPWPTPRRGSLPDAANILVADASVWINLAATGRAADLLRVSKQTLVITDVAFAELERGRPKGRQAADEVVALVHIGLVKIVRCPVEHDDLLLSLVAGAASETLDDGEAATLVFAHSCNGVALIDERKATALAARRFPHLILQATTDLLLAPEMLGALGQDAISDAIHRALVDARMRVPARHISAVIALIGPERAQGCTSLPAVHRTLSLSPALDLPIP